MFVMVLAFVHTLTSCVWRWADRRMQTLNWQQCNCYASVLVTRASSAVSSSVRNKHNFTSCQVSYRHFVFIQFNKSVI